MSILFYDRSRSNSIESRNLFCECENIRAHGSGNEPPLVRNSPHSTSVPRQSRQVFWRLYRHPEAHYHDASQTVALRDSLYPRITSRAHNELSVPPSCRHFGAASTSRTFEQPSRRRPHGTARDHHLRKDDRSSPPRPTSAASQKEAKDEWPGQAEDHSTQRIIAIRDTRCKRSLRMRTRATRQIADGAAKHLHALQALKRPCDKWDDILIVMLASKLDPRTAREWQSSLTGSELPTLKQFFKFLNHYCQTLEASAKPNNNVAKSTAKGSQADSKRQLSLSATVKTKCNHCKGQANCPSGNCRVCRVKHNTLLHPTAANTAASEESDRDAGDSKPTNAAQVTSTHASQLANDSGVILSTAVMFALDSQGRARPYRVLLDCDSQANFISKQYLKNLGLVPRKSNITITGVNGSATTSSQVVNAQLQSRVNSYTTVAECVVTDRVTEKLPSVSFPRNAVRLPRNIQLADPNFNVSSEIDILIGAELFWDLLCVGQINSTSNHPQLQKTRLGWILAGPRLDNQSVITRADRPPLSNYSPQEKFCEQHFVDNVTRNSQGQYIVKLPVKEHLLPSLGNSQDIAFKRLKALERRLSRDASLKQQYAKFMKDYLTLGHMRAIPPSVSENAVPHHCVFKVTSGSSKLCVVFDASCKSDTGVSLNDLLEVGPVIQQDLASMLMRFRYFRYVMSADIVKMYRQILVDQSQTSLQRTLWRDNPEEEAVTHELLAVTYGTSAASFLATRCLAHLADQHGSEFPLGALRVKRDFYVDDLLTRADSIQELEIIRDEAIQLLRAGLFELSKWASNCHQLLELLRERGDEFITLNNDNSSILGIKWNQAQDTFHFSCELDPACSANTKQAILSETARCFDPLGLLGPTTVAQWRAG
ncbi:hypothetical protein ALC57_09939 [Trachymyrmex cornetzi]|uniref:Uncharacterized protein n=1 Tax=Trachymyrmex cornetzi TaxID=471704 RepID=A0A151J4R7_9HYME|nr:hypothetical protein ALC57_09939 [Trachymyrmex cornetzi]